MPEAETIVTGTDEHGAHIFVVAKRRAIVPRQCGVRGNRSRLLACEFVPDVHWPYAGQIDARNSPCRVYRQETGGGCSRSAKRGPASSP
jgi:hypothetical protein